MIYTLVNNIVIPGKMGEWGEIFSKEMPPLYPKTGKLVASFHGYTGNMNAGYHIWAYDDLAAYQKIRVAQARDADYQKVLIHLTSLLVSRTDTILEPNPWSPMK